MTIKIPASLGEIGEYDKYSGQCPTCLSHNYLYVWYGKEDRRDFCAHFIRMKNNQMTFRTAAEYKKLLQVNHG